MSKHSNLRCFVNQGFKPILRSRRKSDQVQIAACVFYTTLYFSIFSIEHIHWFSRNRVWILFQLWLLQPSTSFTPITGKRKMAKSRTCEVGATLLTISSSKLCVLTYLQEQIMWYNKIKFAWTLWLVLGLITLLKSNEKLGAVVNMNVINMLVAEIMRYITQI
jgi:hypothetical protein